MRKLLLFGVTIEVAVVTQHISPSFEVVPHVSAHQDKLCP